MPMKVIPEFAFANNCNRILEPKMVTHNQPQNPKALPSVGLKRTQNRNGNKKGEKEEKTNGGDPRHTGRGAPRADRPEPTPPGGGEADKGGPGTGGS